MASFERRGNKIRAVVHSKHLKKKKISKTFETQDKAEVWVKEIEMQINQAALKEASHEKSLELEIKDNSSRLKWNCVEPKNLTLRELIVLSEKFDANVLVTHLTLAKKYGACMKIKDVAALFNMTERATISNLENLNVDYRKVGRSYIIPTIEVALFTHGKSN